MENRSVRSVVREIRAVGVALARHVDDAPAAVTAAALARIRDLAAHGHALVDPDPVTDPVTVAELDSWLAEREPEPDAAVRATAGACPGCGGRVFGDGGDVREIHAAECRTGLERLAVELAGPDRRSEHAAAADALARYSDHGRWR